MNLKLLFSFFYLCLWALPICGQDKSPFVIRQVETASKNIAITFDDGPNPITTPQILHILQKTNSKASFFLTGRNVQRYNHLAEAIRSEHHNVGNHGINHERISTLGPEAMIKVIAESQLIFYENTGVLPRFYRPPYGDYKNTQRNLLEMHFDKLILWNIDPKDWYKKNNEKAIIQHILKRLKPGSIILLHENQKTVKLLPKLIKKIKKRGYRSVTIESLLGM